MSNYIESNNLGRKSGPVSGIERIRYSGCFITLKIEGENSGPTKSAGFMGIPVLRGSGIEGFYCIKAASTYVRQDALLDDQEYGGDGNGGSTRRYNGRDDHPPVCGHRVHLSLLYEFYSHFNKM